MINEVLKVEGMTCDHCRMTVTNAVSALKGVSELGVSLEEKTVSVSYDEAQVSLDTIKEAIDSRGYEVA